MTWKITVRNKTQERQVMQMRTVVHHQPTDAQSVPEQRPRRQPSPQFISGHDVIQHGLSLWSVGVSCPGCVPSHILVHSQSSRLRQISL